MFWKKLFKDSSLPLAKIDYDFYFNADKHGDIELSVLDLGELNVTTGNIVVCDPLAYLGDTSPLVKKIQPGLYPVRVAIAKTAEIGERYALAKLEITKNKSIKWELAVTKETEKKAKDLKEDEYFGFPVDAGLGCFCDSMTQEQYAIFMDSFLNEHEGANMYNDYFAERFKVNALNQDDPNDIGDWLNYYVPNTKNNIIMFHSGFGDGYYPAYWGFDSDGHVASLMIDFQVFGDDKL